MSLEANYGIENNSPMTANETQVAISRQTGVPAELTADFNRVLDDLSIVHEEREQEPRVYMANEYFVPTIVVVYLAKPFFESFLKEAGKDAYSLFKRSLTLLVQRASLIKVSIVKSGRDKIQDESPYSRVISVYARTRSEVPIKFLIPAGITEDEMSEIVGAMLQLMNENYLKSGDDRLAKMLAESGMKSLQVFRYCKEVHSWLLLSKDFVKPSGR